MDREKVYRIRVALAMRDWLEGIEPLTLVSIVRLEILFKRTVYTCIEEHNAADHATCDF